MATQPQPNPQPHPAPPPTPKPEDEEKAAKERAAKAKKLFDDNENDEDTPVTTQTDQLVRSSEMEEVGVAAWMAESERRIRDRQGDPPDEPRQVRGVGTPQRPR